MLLRVLAIFLILSCTPQLFDNWSRSLIHPAFHFTAALDPYFIPHGNAATVQLEGAYTDLTRTIAGSSCHNVGIADMVTSEYPIWVGLHHFGWTGTLTDVDVRNASKSLEIPRFHPCALVRQPRRGRIFHDRGMTAYAFDALQLSIEPGTLARSPLPIPAGATVEPQRSRGGP